MTPKWSKPFLNPKLDTATGDVQRNYDRYENFDEKRAALELWAGKLTSILGLEPAENVVPLPTRAGCPPAPVADSPVREEAGEYTLPALWCDRGVLQRHLRLTGFTTNSYPPRLA